MDRFIEASLSNPLPNKTRDTLLRTVTYTLEGLTTHAAGTDEARQTCDLLATILES